MIDSLFEKRPKRHVRDLNIVPILDMLTTVIFFLLMSTSFMEYTKLTVPPSATASVDLGSAPPPLSTRLLVGPGTEGRLELLLSWQGTQPGELRRSVAPAELLAAGRELAKDFRTKHPDEKTIQLGLERNVSYQNLITVMDGVREQLPDVVLTSYVETETYRRAMPAAPGSAK